MDAGPIDPVRSVTEGKAASLLLDGRKARMLELCRTPRSATGLGKIMGQPRQRINYHLGLLRKAGLVRPAGTRPKRGLTERLYQASAWAYELAPELLTPALQARDRPGDAAADFGMRKTVRFKDEDQRAAFAVYVEAAVRNAIENHTHTAAIDADKTRAFDLEVALRSRGGPTPGGAQESG